MPSATWSNHPSASTLHQFDCIIRRTKLISAACAEDLNSRSMRWVTGFGGPNLSITTFEASCNGASCPTKRRPAERSNSTTAVAAVRVNQRARMMGRGRATTKE